MKSILRLWQPDIRKQLFWQRWRLKAKEGLRVWWLNLNKWPIVVGLLALIFVGSAYLFKLNWTGFSGQTLWSWLQLAIIPLAIYWFGQAQKKNEQKIALNSHQDAVLQDYIDKISELLLREQLGESAPPAAVVAIARARTAIVLRNLDTDRSANLLRFLSGANILVVCIGDLLVGADLQRINLEGTDLRGINLKKANLYRANLRETNLQKANLERANLQSAALWYADLQGTFLQDANLQHTRLVGAKLQEAWLGGADLRGATLMHANLYKAKITQGQLQSILHLHDATMPDGSKYKVTK